MNEEIEKWLDIKMHLENDIQYTLEDIHTYSDEYDVEHLEELLIELNDRLEIVIDNLKTLGYTDDKRIKPIEIEIKRQFSNIFLLENKDKTIEYLNNRICNDYLENIELYINSKKISNVDDWVEWKTIFNDKYI